MIMTDNFTTYDDFDKYDNFYTIDKKLHVIYGHYHPDDDALFLYYKVHNHKIQDNSLCICSDTQLLNNKNKDKYRYNNLTDAEFVVKNLKSNT